MTESSIFTRHILQEETDAYLANESENEIIDGDIPIQSKRKANEENQMMNQYCRDPATV